MIRLLAIAALLATPTAYAGMCDDYRAIAAHIMEQRQAGQTQREIVESAPQSATGPFYTMYARVTENAFLAPQHNSEAKQQDTVEQFSRIAYEGCRKHSR